MTDLMAERLYEWRENLGLSFSEMPLPYVPQSRAHPSRKMAYASSLLKFLLSKALMRFCAP